MSDDLLKRLDDWGNAKRLEYLPSLGRAAAARVRELEAERDSWCDQADQRVKDWDDMRQRAERAEAERDALRRDAERYRWLKANARRIDFAGLSWTQGCELDARIDAALKESP